MPAVKFAPVGYSGLDTALADFRVAHHQRRAIVTKRGMNLVCREDRRGNSSIWRCGACLRGNLGKAEIGTVCKVCKAKVVN